MFSLSDHRIGSQPRLRIVHASMDNPISKVALASRARAEMVLGCCVSRCVTPARGQCFHAATGTERSAPRGINSESMPLRLTERRFRACWDQPMRRPCARRPAKPPHHAPTRGRGESLLWRILNSDAKLIEPIQVILDHMRRPVSRRASRVTVVRLRRSDLSAAAAWHSHSTSTSQPWARSAWKACASRS